MIIQIEITKTERDKKTVLPLHTVLLRCQQTGSEIIKTQTTCLEDIIYYINTMIE